MFLATFLSKLQLILDCYTLICQCTNFLSIVAWKENRNRVTYIKTLN